MTLTTLNIDIKINTEGNISTRALGNGALGNRKKKSGIKWERSLKY